MQAVSWLFIVVVFWWSPDGSGRRGRGCPGRRGDDEQREILKPSCGHIGGSDSRLLLQY